MTLELRVEEQAAAQTVRSLPLLQAHGLPHPVLLACLGASVAFALRAFYTWDTGFGKERAPLVPTAPLKPEPQARLYYLDWMRCVAIYLVVLFHCVQGCGFLGLYGAAEQPAVKAYQLACLQSGMPVFFHIAGRAQALSTATSWPRQALARAQRLLLPALAGWALLLPFWFYLGLKNEHTVSVGTWLAYYFNPRSPHWDLAWLWFLPVLWGIGAVQLPVFLACGAVRQRRNPLVHFVGYVALLGLVAGLLAVFQPALSALIVPLVALGPLVGLLLCSADQPLPAEDPQQPEDQQRAARVICRLAVSSEWLRSAVVSGAHILATLLLGVSFQYADLKARGACKALPAFAFFCIFYSHGYFEQDALRKLPAGGRAEAGDLQAQERRAACQEQLVQGLKPFLFFCTLASLYVGTVSGPEEEFLFPVYSGGWHGSPGYVTLHLLGTWGFIYLACPLAQKKLNVEVSPVFYQHAVQSVLIVYVFHWMFIKTLVFWVFGPYGLDHGFWKIALPPALFVLSVALSLVVYAGLRACPRIGMIFGL